MPAGAKKRKAAKRKKGKQAQLNISLGSDDLKTIDEKESDGGEVRTPTSPGNHSFMEGEEEEKIEVPPRSIDSRNKSMAEVSGDGERTHDVVIEDEGVAQLDGELKSELDFENKNGEETYDQFSSSSSSSSSDDEGQVVEEASVVEELETMEEVDHSSALEGEPLVDLNENPEVLSLPEEVNHVNGHAPVEEIHASLVDVVPVINPVNPDVSVNESKFLETKNVDESVEDTMSYVNPNVSPNEKLLASDNADLCVEDTLTSDTFVPELKENGEKVQPELDVSSLVKPLEMEVRKDEEITCPILEETIVPLLSAVNSTSKENVHELLCSSDVQTESWNGAEETTTPEVDLALNKNVEIVPSGIVPSVPEGYEGVTLKTETCAAEETINAEVNLASNETDGKVPSVSEGYEGVTLTATDYTSKANEGTLPRDTLFHENNNATEVLQIDKTLEEAVDILIPLGQDAVVSSRVTDPALKEIENKQLQSLNDSTTETNNDAANTKNSVNSEGLQDQTPPVTVLGGTLECCDKLGFAFMVVNLS
ncbi:hypothetical protein RJ641_001891 [Dillenia turbinata]|uniref:Uncharacterized protein n=1 Tax=Dillenia turbinata TaxID=194707 RepID=A0AAN8ZBZ4_9MAGN